MLQGGWLRLAGPAGQGCVMHVADRAAAAGLGVVRGHSCRPSAAALAVKSRRADNWGDVLVH